MNEMNVKLKVVEKEKVEALTKIGHLNALINTPRADSQEDKKLENHVGIKQSKMDPTVKDLPGEVKEIVSKGSKEKVIPGLGNCLIGTTEAHIAGDVENTTQLSRDLNTHMAMYRAIYLETMIFPLDITIGVNGETKYFEKGQEQEFFDWLLEAPEAAFMWRGCTDMLGLANMIRMDIDCIVHVQGTEPQVYHFSPDPDFPFLDEDKMKPLDPTKRLQPKMTVLNYKDNHYNLIVEKDSMLAQSGSFTFQRKAAKINELEKKEKNVDISIETVLKKKIDDLERTIQQVLLENEKLRQHNSGGGQGKAEVPAQLVDPVGGGQGMAGTTVQGASGELGPGDEIFLADEARWQNMELAPENIEVSLDPPR